MTLPVVWDDEAETALLTILDYIGPRNKPAVERLYAAIRHTADNLPNHPYTHRPAARPARAKPWFIPIISSSTASGSKRSRY
ncbi:type II toxin-antitoxin system RelE/ParE family toxin [Sphingobium scionense]